MQKYNNSYKKKHFGDNYWVLGVGFWVVSVGWWGFVVMGDEGWGMILAFGSFELWRGDGAIEKEELLQLIYKFFL